MSSRSIAPARPTAEFRAGLYAEYLRRANESSQKARAYAESRAGESDRRPDPLLPDRRVEGLDSVSASIGCQNDEPVDFANGFIEIYRDARGAKGTSQSFVSITDQKLSSAIVKIAANAQYFEDTRAVGCAI